MSFGVRVCSSEFRFWLNNYNHTTTTTTTTLFFTFADGLGFDT